MSEMKSMLIEKQKRVSFLKSGASKKDDMNQLNMQVIRNSEEERIEWKKYLKREMMKFL